MSNPIKKLISRGSADNATDAAAGCSNALMEQFNQFRRTFSGNPQEAINKLLSSGRYNQAQIDQARAIAQKLRGMFR